MLSCFFPGPGLFSVGTPQRGAVLSKMEKAAKAVKPIPGNYRRNVFDIGIGNVGLARLKAARLSLRITPGGELWDDVTTLTFSLLDPLLHRSLLSPGFIFT